jgi:GGDEF domain-containing protein
VALERLRGRLAEAVAGTPYRVTTTVGAVVFPAAPGTVEAMVRDADARMYAGKVAGRNRLVLEVNDP